MLRQTRLTFSTTEGNYESKDKESRGAGVEPTEPLGFSESTPESMSPQREDGHSPSYEFNVEPSTPSLEEIGSEDEISDRE